MESGVRGYTWSPDHHWPSPDPSYLNLNVRLGQFDLYLTFTWSHLTSTWTSPDLTWHPPGLHPKLTWSSPEDHLTIIWPFPDHYLTIISRFELNKSCLVVVGWVVIGGPTHYNPYLRVSLDVLQTCPGVNQDVRERPWAWQLTHICIFKYFVTKLLFKIPWMFFYNGGHKMSGYLGLCLFFRRMCSCARWFELEYEIGLQHNLLASAYNEFLQILWSPIKGPRLRSFRYHAHWLTHQLLYNMGLAIQRAGYPLGNVVGKNTLSHSFKIQTFFKERLMANVSTFVSPASRLGHSFVFIITSKIS